MLPFDPRYPSSQLMLVGACILLTIFIDWLAGQVGKTLARSSPMAARGDADHKGSPIAGA